MLVRECHVLVGVGHGAARVEAQQARQATTVSGAHSARENRLPVRPRMAAPVAAAKGTKRTRLLPRTCASVGCCGREGRGAMRARSCPAAR
jgi:hypothetical protein